MEKWVYHSWPGAYAVLRALALQEGQLPEGELKALQKAARDVLEGNNPGGSPPFDWRESVISPHYKLG